METTRLKDYAQLLKSSCIEPHPEDKYQQALELVDKLKKERGMSEDERSTRQRA
jgi:HPt (histidine-containing phosphotransfer) domain-containing protein